MNIQTYKLDEEKNENQNGTRDYKRKKAHSHYETLMLVIIGDLKLLKFLVFYLTSIHHRQLPIFYSLPNYIKATHIFIIKNTNGSTQLDIIKHFLALVTINL